MILNKMSDNAEFSIWSNDESELLDNIDKEIKLINSDSESGSNPANQANGESWKAFQKNETPVVSQGEKECGQSAQSDVDKWNQSMEVPKESSNTHSDKLNLQFSSNDMSDVPSEGIPQSESIPNCVSSFNHSNSCMSLSRNEKQSCGGKKYDHIESKVKQYFNDKHSGKDAVLTERSKMANEVKEHANGKEISKEHYLEEVNKRLTRELEEKNALLMKLQENYENLLLKYAEAQNKIDQLRLKSEISRTECAHSDFKQGFQRTFFQMPLNAFEAERDHHEAWEDGKCQKAVVAPFMKDGYQMKSDGRASKMDRPSSLPVDSSAKFLEKDVAKAGTPTDSEGVSSVITSMSGHSKILNTLDAQSPNSRDSKLLPYPERDFILNDSSVVNDAFDKVKNWQNSLPPLELIETPETTLYDEPPMHISPSNNYRDMASPKVSDDGDAFSSTRVHNSDPIPFKSDGNSSEVILKEYIRVLSLPSFVRKKASKTPNDEALEQSPNPFPEDDIPSACIIQRRRKKPTLLRCSSLPAYEYDSPKSTHRSPYIPPLDLENLTLSDAESSRPEYDYGKGNRPTSSSYIASQSGSVDFSSQTCRSVNSFRGRLTDYTESPYSTRPSFNKSTSITPDRCNDLASRSFARSRLDEDNLCDVCGEKFADGVETTNGFPCRSNSYQSFHEVNDSPLRSSERRGKHPFHRSMSFNSETNSRGRCCHEREICSLHRRSHDSLEKFDIYTSNLKARSQVIMKALAAHVTNT